ncbi:hypothetical protein IKO50_06455 [bacterium]|jgi:hypothetical protein|nr:hypothetical protein [bacterium]
MKATTKQRLLHKKESERSRKEKICRDIACYGVTIFAALMGFLLVDANASLAEAEADAADAGVVVAQHLN